MQRNDLISQLKGEISENEAVLLRNHQIEHISRSNEAIILELLDADHMRDTDEICDTEIEGLRKVTYEYLAKYLPEYPGSWKWIFISCAYQTFIKKEPMHSKEWVHYTEKVENGEKIYYCPAKSKVTNTSCSYCVCHFMTD